MSQLEELEREEFIQSYLQYRWLDDTRAKLVDRYFIILTAVFVARFEFPFLEDRWAWKLALYSLFVLLSIFIAKSIISFRRQQRGHGLYINVIRRRIISERGTELGEYGEFLRYVKGKPVFLTSWVEFVVASSATLAPTIFLDIVYDSSNMLPFANVFLVIALIAGLIAANLVFLLTPWWRYNRPKTPEWCRV